MLLPVTAHSAFRKGAWLFDVEIVDIPVNADFKADVDAMVAAMDERAALAVVSAPSYAHGVIDPVAEVAAAAAERDLLCHLDLCIGGWALPFIREAEGQSPVDMSIPGVTSASMDLHKYGYAPKGVSILLNATPNCGRTTSSPTPAGPVPLINNTCCPAGPQPRLPPLGGAALAGREGLRDLALKSRAGAAAHR